MGNEPGDGRPLIGLTVEVLEPPLYEGRRRYQLFTDYLEGCLREAGGVGILIPGDTPPDDLGPILEALDGILLTGGDDLDLRSLGGPAPLETSKPVPPLQQAFNLALVEEAGRRKMPTLGVCLGMQVMVVEHAERFGLAQLHQLRGRVGRGPARSHCLLTYHPPLSESARARLDALAATDDGFEVAERDLELRGPGDFFGTRQSGLPVFRVGDVIRDHRVMDDARRAAFLWLDSGEPADDDLQAVRDGWAVRYGLVGVG